MCVCVCCVCCIKMTQMQKLSQSDETMCSSPNKEALPSAPLCPSVRGAASGIHGLGAAGLTEETQPPSCASHSCLLSPQLDHRNSPLGECGARNSPASALPSRDKRIIRCNRFHIILAAEVSHSIAKEIHYSNCFT